jgi:hypothetical protein
MLPDVTYMHSPRLAAARYLQRAGQWDLALESMREADSGASPALRAEILVDRHAWRLDPPGEALRSVKILADADPPLALLLTGQLGYWQQVFRLGGATISQDLEATFAEAAQDARLRGWATFFRGVVYQYLHENRQVAATGFADALAFALEAGDLLLESYALRHQGELALDEAREQAVQALRRSLSLRAALGARPHCAAGQATLADALGDVPEAADLRRAAGYAASELGLTWLK